MNAQRVLYIIQFIFKLKLFWSIWINDGDISDMILLVKFNDLDI
jgi:hypothetical protein